MKPFMRKLFFAAIVMNLANADTTEDFFYQRGFEVGFNQGYERGVKEAFIEAKAMLEKYGASLKAYEIGKYLIKSQNLTYPQVWQEISNDGKVSLRVIPSEIVKELDIDALFSKFATIPSLKTPQTTSLEPSLDEKNAVNLNARDSNFNNLAQDVAAQNKKQTLKITKSYKNLEILKKANVVFSDEGGSYNVLFFTNAEKQDFCKQYEICGGKK